MDRQITGQDVERMARHWFKRPVNSYYGCGYGHSLPEVLFNPFGADKANEQVDKLKEDVPVLGILPEGSVNLYSVNTPPDRTEIIAAIAGRTIALEL